MISGVEVVQSKVRRERLGHIELASPVAHIWCVKGRPSIIGALLDMTIMNLEKVLYFENYIVTDSGDTPLKEKELPNEDTYKKNAREYGSRFTAGMGAEAIRELLRRLDLGALSIKLRQDIKQTRSEISKTKLTKRLRIIEAFRKSGNKPEWMIMDVIPVLPPDLRPFVPLEGGRFATSDLNDLYRRVINRNNRLKRLMELEGPSVIIKNEKRMLHEAVDALFDNGRRSKILKTMTKRLLMSLSDMIKGKEGRFRQNLLGKRVDYSGRSVIVPDPTLKLHQCGLPKKMALELFRPFIFHKLEEKGQATTLKAAKKLVEVANEYSSPSSFYEFVGDDAINKEEIYNRLIDLQSKGFIKIISNNLKDNASKIWDSLSETRTANEDKIIMPPTFQRVLSEVIEKGYIAIGKNIRKEIISRRSEVYEALEEVMQEHPVLLNRQPTLHKFNIMAFDPVLVEGKALRLNPLVCKAFSADFDGDQMAIYVPLSMEAQVEARVLMASVNNILSPANGDPIIMPTQDIVLGIYYLTKEKPDARWNRLTFSGADEVRIAYDAGVINEHTKIKVRIDGELIETTTGRVLLKEILPCGFPFSLINKTIKKDNIQKIVKYLYSEFGAQDTVKFLNQLMNLGFEYATKSGISICMDDVIVPIWKDSIIEDAKNKEAEYISTLSNEEEDSDPSLSNEQEGMILEVWKKAVKLLDDEVIKEFEKADSFFNSIYMMIDSGARGNWNQLSRIAGIKGFRPYSVEDIIPYVITSNYKEGLSPLEYFVSASQMHQPLVHVTKLTTGAGWLMRRLADVAQDIVITEDDCRTQDGIYVTAESINDMTLQFLEERIIGRISEEEIRCPETGELFLEPDKEITEKIAKRIIESGIKKAKIRSILTCQATFGVCAKCYGRDLARGEVVEKGEAVGIIAAQSIGGPTIQSVLDTRHSYRQMSDDNTQSILEIIRLFEGRIPKRSSINYHKILTESGLREAQLFLLNKFQSIYRLKNIVSADKHFEIIIRKMTEKIKVEDSGDTIFLRDEIVYRKVFYEENARVKYEGGRPAGGEPLILGITKTALLSDSWVSAAAFQETTKVLTTAAIAAAVDELQGLKENVIIGRLIPAGTGMPRCRTTFVKTD